MRLDCNINSTKHINRTVQYQNQRTSATFPATSQHRGSETLYCFIGKPNRTRANCSSTGNSLIAQMTLERLQYVIVQRRQVWRVRRLSNQSHLVARNLARVRRTTRERALCCNETTGPRRNPSARRQNSKCSRQTSAFTVRSCSIKSQ